MFLPAPPTGVTAVTSVALYADEARENLAYTLTASLSEGRWVISTADVADGRWWATVNAQIVGGPHRYRLPQPVDLPEDDRLLVSPETLATGLGFALPLTPTQRITFLEAILASQSDVAAYLGRQALTPTVRVARGLIAWGERWDIDDDEGVTRIVRVEAVPGHDLYDVTYVAGLDGRNDPALEPIRRYVAVHAENQPDVVNMWRARLSPEEKSIRSSSSEGQSVTYETASLGGGGAAGSGAPGALPGRTSLDYWRLSGIRVVQAPSRYPGLF